MRCKKCNAELEENAKFCSYCGEKVEDEILETKEDYVDPFEQYRQNQSHEGQFEYQQNYSKQDESKEKAETLEQEGFFSKKNYSLFGIILAILAIFGTVEKVALGVILIVLSFALVVIGFKHTKLGMKIMSIVSLILSTILVIIISITIWILNLEIRFPNGMVFTQKEYFISEMNNNQNSDKIYGMWKTNSGEVLDLTAGFSYTIYDKKGQEKFENEFTKIDGYEIVANEFIYSDKDYYFYELGESEQKLTKDTKIILCLDKDDFNRMVIYMPKKEITIETKRIKSLRENNFNNDIDDDYKEIIG